METCPNIRKYRFYNVIVAFNGAFFVETKAGLGAYSVVPGDQERGIRAEWWLIQRGGPAVRETIAIPF